MTPLVDLMLKHNTTISDVVQEIGVDEQTVMEWCTGIGVPNAKTAISMAACIGCSLKELYLAIIRTRR